MSIYTKMKETMAKLFEAFNSYTESQLQISAKEIGSKVEVKNADGTLSPIEDGTHTVGDFTFTTKDGVITSIEGQEQPQEEPATEEVKAEDVPTEEPVEDETAPADAEEDVKEEDSVIAEMQSKIDALQTKVDEIYSMIEGMKSTSEEQTKLAEAFNSTVGEINETILKLAKIPVQPSKSVPVKQAQDSEKNKIDLIKFLSEKKIK